MSDVELVKWTVKLITRYAVFRQSDTSFEQMGEYWTEDVAQKASTALQKQEVESGLESLLTR